MKSITEAGDLKGKSVIVRVDWNVPLKEGKVGDLFRIEQSLPTIGYLQRAGAKIVLLSHFTGEGDSLAPIAEAAKLFLPNLIFNDVGDLILLENLRLDPGEEANSREYAEKLSELGEIYVNEAFSVSHRSHASLVTLPKLLPSYAGIHLVQEVTELSKAFYPQHPFIFILGGAKFDTKLPLIKKFLGLADYVFVGGALANNFFKVMGKDIGTSLVSEGEFGIPEILATGKILLPEDTVVVEGKILDAGALTLEKLKEKIKEAKLILWNGPLGNYEKGYRFGTRVLAEAIAESGKTSIVGGGDTLDAIRELKLLNRFTFVSTGGGAMLDFLANGTLPAIEALN